MTPTPRLARRRAAPPRSARTAVAMAALLAVSAVPLAAHAAVINEFTWNGGSNFAAGTTWFGKAAPPTDGLTTAAWFFGTVAGVAIPPSTTLSLPTPYSAYALTFKEGAYAYTFQTSALTLGTGGLTQNAANAQTFNNPLILGADQTWTLASGAGALNLAGGLDTTGGPGAIDRALTINAASSTSNGNVVNGVISGGGSLTKTGLGLLTLTGASTYSGVTTVSEGRLAIGSGASIKGSNLDVRDGATLAITGTGRVAPTGPLAVGGALGAGGGTSTLSLSDSASFSAGATAYIGKGGSGTVDQTGGSFTSNTRELYVGYDAGSTGTYNLSGSASVLSTGVVHIGFNGTGTVNQSAGSFTTNGRTLYLGDAGSGTFNLSGTGSLSAGLTYIGAGGTGTFNQTGGSFTTQGNTLNLADGGSGTYNLGGGTLSTGSVRGAGGASTFNFNGGTLQAAASTTSFMQGVTNANVQSGGAKIDSNGFNVTIAQKLVHDTTLGAPAVDGGLTKLGAGTLTLTGDNTFNGAVNINAGRLVAASESSLGAGKEVNVGNGATLAFAGSASMTRTYNLGLSTLTNASGNTLTIGGGTLNGGFLAGSGTFALTDGATLNATRAGTGTVLNQTAGTATFNNVLLTGTSSFTQAAGATLNTTGDFTANPQTTLVVNGAVNLQQGGSISGALTINRGGVVTALGGDSAALYLSGGTTTVNRDGTLVAAAGTTIELSGGLLVNNGTQSGVLDVNGRGVAKGSGSFGTVIVGDGGTFSPGNSPGTATAENVSFASGGHDRFELNTANPSFGLTSDLLVVTHTLSIDAGTTADSVFTIDIDSLDLSNRSAALTDFNSSLSYHWLLVDANAVTGFDSSKFYVVAPAIRPHPA